LSEYVVATVDTYHKLLSKLDSKTDHKRTDGYVLMGCYYNVLQWLRKCKDAIALWYMLHHYVFIIYDRKVQPSVLHYAITASSTNYLVRQWNIEIQTSATVSELATRIPHYWFECFNTTTEVNVLCTTNYIRYYFVYSCDTRIT